MELTICHLYPDLLNVYGDVGNVLILKHRAALRDINVNIINCSIGETIVKDNVDIIFFGGGQDYEQSIVSNDLKEIKGEAIASYIEECTEWDVIPSSGGSYRSFCLHCCQDNQGTIFLQFEIFKGVRLVLGT